MKTIAQQLGVTEFPFQIKNKDCNEIYYEDCTGYWVKCEYDSDGNKTYFEDSNGYWTKRKYDSDGNEIYYENSNGFWTKREYDSSGNEIFYQDSDNSWSKWEYDSEGNAIYHEDQDGVIIDDRPSENIERIREFFRQVRLMTHHHLGLGAIKLTVEQQEELCELVESLINKTTEQ